LTYYCIDENICFYRVNKTFKLAQMLRIHLCYFNVIRKVVIILSAVLI